MITIENITKKYHPDIDVLKGIDIAVDSGEFVFLVGQSGAGKSTLVKLLTAEERPTSGRVVIGGWDITNIKGKEIPRLRRQTP